MKFTLTFFISLLVISTSAQSGFQKINRDSVKTAISDPAQTSFYPKLLERFQNFDTSLTLNDHRLLYYGFVFQPEYSAYGDIKTKEIQAAITERDYGKAIITIDTVLKTVPISLKANYQKAVALYLFDSTSLAYLRYAKRYASLLAAILSTGDGMTCPTSFKTIFVADEYEVMYRHFMIQQFLGQGLNFPCDKMRVGPNEYFKGSEMYFDISEAFNQLDNLFGEPKKKKKKKKD